MSEIIRMKLLSLRSGFGLALCLLLASCATDPAIGSRTWHEGRIGEIETALELEEISTEDYLSLKNEADQTRVEYQNAMRERLRNRPSYGYYPYHSIRHYGHYYPHHYH